MKLCKLLLSHVGENFPCTEPPGPEFTGYENAYVLWDGLQAGEEPEDPCGEAMEYVFKVTLSFARLDRTGFLIYLQ